MDLNIRSESVNLLQKMKYNLLKVAIEADEIGDFFRGNGKYFKPSSDYGGHVHGAHMGGAARVFAEESSSNAMIFDKIFLEFLNDLTVSKEDAGHLLANLSSYFAQKNRGGFSESKIFESDSSPGSIAVKLYFFKVKQTPVISEVKEQIQRHARFIKEKGNSFLDDFVKD